MIDIEWGRLRPLEGSQAKAFEELVAQLASQELNAGVSIRKGTPDAGVEHFWQLPNGDEKAIQAKFFDAFNAGRWGQIDNSVKKALASHPKLRRYIVAVPVNRSDARLKGKKSALETWNERVKKWRVLTRNKVDFEYWGDHELRQKLQRPENQGLVRYWFDKTILSDEWFKGHAAAAREFSWPRYTPDAHVKLPIAKKIEAFGRDATYRLGLNEQAKKLGSVGNRVITTANSAWDDILRQAATVAAELSGALRAHTSSPAKVLDLDNLAGKIDLATRALWPIIDATTERYDPTNAPARAQSAPIKNAREVNTAARALREELYRIERDIHDDAMRLANSNFLILAGEAGTGKTHLLVDIAQRRVKDGEPTIILFGEHFNDQTDPIRTIVERLQIPLDADELLPTLQAAAVTRRSRLVIMIDALNETTGRDMWRAELAKLHQDISKYPNLALLVSVRTTYESDVIREDIARRAKRIEHEGFADVQFLATKTFFEHYKIQPPTSPLLLPEYRNPLFLRLLCQGLHERGETRLPAGLHGIRALFKFHLDAVNRTGAKRCDYTEDLELTNSFVDKIAHRMARTGHRWIPLEEADSLSQQILARPASKSLLHHLTTEGVLKRTTQHHNPQQLDHVVKAVEFGYERLGDHVIAKTLIDECGGRIDTESFTSRPLRPIVKGDIGSAGVLEAITLFVAEEQNEELLDLAPAESFEKLAYPFLRSLAWRHPAKISARSVELAEKAWAFAEQYNPGIRFNILLSIAGSPGQPLNATYLHSILEPLSVQERDTSWSIYLHRARGRMSALDRLIAWVQGLPSGSKLEPEAAKLVATTLVWMLSTPNRELRDTATRCLVKIFDHESSITPFLIEKFRQVNDPYILERLTCAAYGHALRAPKRETTVELARTIYRFFFQENPPPVHILTRDYARGIVEVGLRAGLSGIDASRIKPPYGASWIEPPLTKQQLKARVEQDVKEGTDAKSAAYALWSSTMGWGDFARYIIGSDHGFEWQDKRLDGTRTLTRRERIAAFIVSLDAHQAAAWRDYEDALKARTAAEQAELEELLKERSTPPTLVILKARPRAHDDAVRRAEAKFVATLDPDKKEIYEELHPQHPSVREQERPIAVQRVQRAIMTRILDLGWDAHTFGEFDSEVGHGRVRPNKGRVDRIGKKYQWIAYHEVLARAADNFYRVSGSVYESAADLGLRDIDPSVLRESASQAYYDPPRTWWFLPPAGWNNDESDLAWVKDKETWPDVGKLLMPTDASGKRWLMLASHFSVSQPRPPDEPKDYEHQRILQGWPEAYVVRRAKTAEFVRWLRKPGNAERFRMHDSWPHNVFLGEFPQGSSFLAAEGGYGRTGWRSIEGATVKAAPAGDSYYWESRSGGNSLKAEIPSRHLFDALGIEYDGHEGAYYRNGEMVASDPSVTEEGPGTLLVDPDLLVAGLRRKRWDIVWVVSMEKQASAPDRKGDCGYTVARGVYVLDGSVPKGTLAFAYHAPRPQRTKAGKHPRRKSAKTKPKAKKMKAAEKMSKRKRRN